MAINIEESLLKENAETNLSIKHELATTLRSSSGDASVIIDNKIDFQESNCNLLSLAPSTTRQTQTKTVYLFAKRAESKEFNFIIKTYPVIEYKLSIKVVLTNEIERCTHMILSDSRCLEYIEGIVRGKCVVGFSWYIELLDNDVLSLETITLLHLLNREASDATELACLYGSEGKYFSSVNVVGYFFSEEIERLIHENGGTINARNDRSSLLLESDEDFFQMVAEGSKSKWYSALFPDRDKRFC
ncbi:hypothetical protein NEDG_00707 [Nematocida displodere]|uniref:BRCT domain-containing protein n=1 Tax=Nematocida displodere TaxID=1805483 RepID=A0A177EC97_9MICR|nr:hypothetical protein NEDG_00707 [Nematocida displodere]